MERNGKWFSRTDRGAKGMTPEQKREAAEILADLERQGYDPEAVVQGIRKAIAAHPDRRPTFAEVKEAIQAEALLLEEKRHLEWLQRRPKLPDVRPRSLRWFLWALVTWLRWPVFEAGQRVMYWGGIWPFPHRYGTLSGTIWWAWARSTFWLGSTLSGRFWREVDACFEHVMGCDVDGWLEATIQDRARYSEDTVEMLAANAYRIMARHASAMPYPIRRATANQLKRFCEFELKRRNAEVRDAMWKRGPERRVAQ